MLVRCTLLSPKTTSGSRAFVLRAEEACEMVVCAERVDQTLLFHRLPTSPRPHHPAPAQNRLKTRENELKLAIRVEGAACLNFFRTSPAGYCGGWPAS